MAICIGYIVAFRTAPAAYKESTSRKTNRGALPHNVRARIKPRVQDKIKYYEKAIRIEDLKF